MSDGGGGGRAESATSDHPEERLGHAVVEDYATKLAVHILRDVMTLVLTSNTTSSDIKDKSQKAGGVSVYAESQPQGEGQLRLRRRQEDVPVTIAFTNPEERAVHVPAPLSRVLRRLRVSDDDRKGPWEGRASSYPYPHPRPCSSYCPGCVSSKKKASSSSSLTFPQSFLKLFKLDRLRRKMSNIHGIHGGRSTDPEECRHLRPFPFEGKGSSTSSSASSSAPTSSCSRGARALPSPPPCDLTSPVDRDPHGPPSSASSERLNVMDALPPDSDVEGTRSNTSESESSAYFSNSIDQVKDYGWYWGPLSSEEAEDLLREEPDGSFIVRDSSDVHYIFSLTFKLTGVVRHVRIEHDQGNFSFGPLTRFKSSTIVDFVEKAVAHSRSGRYLFFLHRRPSLGPMRVQLLHPVSRFRHPRSLQHMCRFLILKHVRRDLISELPLPKPLQDYLSTQHYYFDHRHLHLLNNTKPEEESPS